MTQTTNKLFGLADPQYDALRVLSTQALQIGSIDNTIPSGGGLENKIYLWPSDGSTIMTYAATQAGLIAALAAASSGDTVWLPSIPIALTVGITIPAGVALASFDNNSILNFSGFGGVAVTLSAGSIAYRPIVNFVATGTDATGILADAADSLVLDPFVNVSGATATNIAIGLGAATPSQEIWIAGDHSSLHNAPFIVWTEDGGTTWEAVASLPAATPTWSGFTGYIDGSAIFVGAESKIYKCANPKDGSPTWSTILEVGTVITGAVTASSYFGMYLRIGACTNDTLYASCVGSDGNVYAGAYTLAGGWTWDSCGDIRSGNSLTQVNQGHYTQSGGVNIYNLRVVGTGTVAYTWAQSQGFDDSSGTIWKNLIGGNYYAERGISDTPALYYFHDITENTDVIGDVFDTRGTNEGYTPLALPTGAWYGDQVYVVDPENGEFYLSDDGVNFNVVYTWAQGMVFDDLQLGGGSLYWIRQVLTNPNPVMQLSGDRGSTFADATGDFWSAANTAANVLLGAVMVWRG